MGANIKSLDRNCAISEKKTKNKQNKFPMKLVLLLKGVPLRNGFILVSFTGEEFYTFSNVMAHRLENNLLTL